MPITINGTGTITGISAGGLPDACITTDDLAANAASGLAKAWVNFDGTGTVAIRASFNVSSITDNGAGDYTVNFTTALVDANYSFNGASRWGAGDEGVVVLYNSTTTLTTSAIRIVVGVPGTANSTSLTASDRADVFVQIFR